MQCRLDNSSALVPTIERQASESSVMTAGQDLKASTGVPVANAQGWWRYRLRGESRDGTVYLVGLGRVAAGTDEVASNLAGDRGSGRAILTRYSYDRSIAAILS